MGVTRTRSRGKLTELKLYIVFHPQVNALLITIRWRVATFFEMVPPDIYLDDN